VRRSEYAENIENNRKRILGSEKLYKRRQAIVEHPYGTIKRQWGYNYILTKKYIERAEADFGLIVTAYNLRRIINIIGLDAMIQYLSKTSPDFVLKWLHKSLKSKFSDTLLNKIKIVQYLHLKLKTAINVLNTPIPKFS